ncbi:hypothetical protein HK100_010659 [Physocladia obscura]|uniref:Uncharacterized protein n=1 Tax=Physocladia obscura TaxID=109957 RepID=A0AAD5XIR6_9FUNG|nr:hypothetical protein HK100_010659 [Physocladia obscura]
MAALASVTSDNSLTCDCSCGTVKVTIGEQICGVTFGGGVVANATASTTVSTAATTTTDTTAQLSCITICKCYCNADLAPSNLPSPSTTIAVWFGVSSATAILILLVYLYGRVVYFRNTTPEQRRQEQLEGRIQSLFVPSRDSPAAVEALPVYQDPLPAYQKTAQTEHNERDAERNTTDGPIV